MTKHTNHWQVRTTALDPTQHCFRADNCARHLHYSGPNCCCCGYPASAHTGCDCDGSVDEGKKRKE